MDSVLLLIVLSTHFFIDSLGTCSMLPREKQGVVDPELKVYGTKNLRIADISIIPLQIATHTQGEQSICMLLPDGLTTSQQLHI